MEYEQNPEQPELAQEKFAASARGSRHFTPGMAEACRRAGAEGAVLLKNENVLPLKSGEPFAVFGRCQNDWFAVGYGSGGDIAPLYTVTPMESMEDRGAAYDRHLASLYREWCAENRPLSANWGAWPLSYPEMPLADAEIRQAAQRCDTALVIFGRAAGEDRDCRREPGSYELTAEERHLLDRVASAFRKTAVILNVGALPDLSWTEAYGDRIGAVLLAWQCGMESGNALCDVLFGEVSPCGCLPDTVPRRYEDLPSAAGFGTADTERYDEGIYTGYRWFDRLEPEKTLYPFGFGLSYTSFSVLPQQPEWDGSVFRLTVRLRNTGCCKGRKAVLLWCRLPAVRLDQPPRVLAGFAKSPELLPGGTWETEIRCRAADIASWDDSSCTWLLEAGRYDFTVCGVPAGSVELLEKQICGRGEHICTDAATLRNRILSRIPPEIPRTGDRGFTLAQVAAGKVSLSDFIAQLSDEELEALSRGEGEMDSPWGPAGNAGAFGGVTESLRGKGIPPVITTDGPAGIRLKQFCSLLPCGTALAAGFDTAAVEKLYSLLGQEMRNRGTDVLLAPGMNIHRNPLCGRNFEYYSEDPLLTGYMAAAAVKGIQSQGVSACVKHFACNNREQGRNHCDSVLSERALREIYLRGFGIAIRESAPDVLMTSYNPVNGVWSHYNYDLAVTVLRREWGFRGLVITDWWMQYAESTLFPGIRDNARRVRAGVDVLMPGGISFSDPGPGADEDLLASLNRPDGLTRGELQLAARHVLSLILSRPLLLRKHHRHDYTTEQVSLQ